MRKYSLNGQWKLYFFEQGEYEIENPEQLKQYDIPMIQCTVPGNVELDLVEAGLLPKDLYKGDNILAVQDYETYEWWYETGFEIPATENGETIVLHFGGVDCLAEYWLNGAKIGESENMFVEIEFDITNQLIEGRNLLAVRLRSPLYEAYRKEYSTYVKYSSWAINNESIHIRKAPHSYGWDIMPRAISAGLWQDVGLVVRDTHEIKHITYAVRSLSKQSAELCFTYDVNLSPKEIKTGAELELEGFCGDSAFSHRARIYFKAGKVHLSVHYPKLWMPYGYGEPYLYNTDIKLIISGQTVAKKQIDIGIRTAELIRTETTDGVNGTFKFRINHTDIMCRGTNWVPLDAFHSREKERYPKALSLLKDIGCNIVRCWGGNVYPDESFYDFCDQNGIMIWQDFAMACHAYPQTEEFFDKIKKEAKYIVKKYQNHPSLILWAGDNECDQMLEQFGSDPGLNQITRKILPDVIHDNDVGRPYLPSSPFISQEIFRKRRLDLAPEDHLWGPRDYFKSRYYTTSKAHFVSEIGYHGCPSIQSIEKFIDHEFIWPYYNNRQWNLHSTRQRNEDDRVQLMAMQIKQLFGEIPDNLEDFVFASQASQAEAKKFFIENVRIRKPIKTGVIWWNLLDGWPQMSDAVVDYYFERKLAYDYIKRSQAPFCIMISEIENWGVKVVAVNDTLSIAKGSFSVKDADTGEMLLEGEFSVGENGIEVLWQIPIMFSDKKMLIIQWNVDGHTVLNHYICGNPPISLEQYKTWYFSELK